MSEAKDEEPVDQRFVKALELSDPGLLALAKSLLEQAEIPYFVRGERAQHLIGWGQLGTGFNIVVGPAAIVVEASRLEDARELLTPLAHAPAAATQDE